MSRGSSNRPRRKAKQARSRETVRTLLEGAARVLEERGYAGATTNRIAEAAGASVGTLYEYFSDKDAVYEALIEQEIGRLVEAIQVDDLDPGAPIASVLERLLGLAMGAMRLGPEFFRSLEQVPGSQFRRRLVRARASVVQFLRGILEAHRSELRVTDLDLAAFTAVSAAEGIGANASSDRFDEGLVQEIAVMLTLYLTGEEPGR